MNTEVIGRRLLKLNIATFLTIARAGVDIVSRAVCQAATFLRFEFPHVKVRLDRPALVAQLYAGDCKLRCIKWSLVAVVVVLDRITEPH